LPVIALAGRVDEAARVACALGKRRSRHPTVVCWARVTLSIFCCCSSSRHPYCLCRMAKRGQPRRTARRCQRLISRPPIVLCVRHSM
jgi:hypothetical protein